MRSPIHAREGEARVSCKHARGASQQVAPPRKSFIVDIDASVLRELSKHARALYTALRYKADAKTGELRFRDRWYKAREFDVWAEMCERVRLAAMQELVTKGLATFTRPRVRRMIGGRLRAVAGPVHYVVHRHPVPLKNRQKTRNSSKLHLQNCISGSLLEMQSQVLSKPPLGAGTVVSEFESSASLGKPKSSSAPASDDYASRASQSNFEERVNDKPNPSRLAGFKSAAFKNIQARSTVSAETINAILDVVIDRAPGVIHSARYLECGFDDFMADVGPDQDAGIIAEVYTKMRFVHGVVEEAARQGQPAREILAQRLAARVQTEANRGTSEVTSEAPL